MEEKQKYKPGFWCTITWLFTWIAIAGMVVSIFLPNNTILWFMRFFIGGIVSAIISYIIRTIEKSKFENRWSWHIKD